MKIKKNKKITKECTNCFSPKYLKFNFSYITYEEDFEDKYKLQFLERIRKLSEVPYIALMNMGKELAFEFEELKIKKQIPESFSQRFSSKDYNGKYAIARLYTNCNPRNSRIIGVMINKIFYIFFIDIKGELYKH